MTGRDAPSSPGLWRWRLAGREVLYVVTGEGTRAVLRPVGPICSAPVGGQWERAEVGESRALAELRAEIARLKAERP